MQGNELAVFILIFCADTDITVCIAYDITDLPFFKKDFIAKDEDCSLSHSTS